MPLIKDDVEELFEFAQFLHMTIIDNSGGAHGIRDEGGLYNSLAKILERKSKGMAPIELCAFSYKEFATRHHFSDGNKRFSHVFSKIMLFDNGFHLEVKYKTSVPFIISIAADKLPLRTIHTWVEKNSKEIDKSKLSEYLDDLEAELAGK